MSRCCDSLSVLPGSQRNPSSWCHSEDFSNKTLEGLSQAQSYVSRSVKFDWQNMEVIKEITRQDRFTAYWQISLYMFCFTARPLWYAGTSEYGVRGNRGETSTGDREQETECERANQEWRGCTSEGCEGLLGVSGCRRTLSYIQYPKGIFRVNLHSSSSPPPLSSCPSTSCLTSSPFLSSSFPPSLLCTSLHLHSLLLFFLCFLSSILFFHTFCSQHTIPSLFSFHSFFLPTQTMAKNSMYRAYEKHLSPYTLWMFHKLCVLDF